MQWLKLNTATSICRSLNIDCASLVVSNAISIADNTVFKKRLINGLICNVNWDEQYCT